MGISSSLNAGVSGLNANANKLATISDNIANSQTYGYKRADVDFSSLTVSDTRRRTPSAAGAGSPPAGCGPTRSGTSRPRAR